MRVLGLPVPFTGERKALSTVDENRGGWLRIFESFSGAWQQNVVVDRNQVLSYPAVYACITLISGDIAKLRVKLLALDANGIWTETKNPAYSPVLRKPNHYQTRIQFFENWILSKLVRGNTYVLKGRDNRGVVNALYVLDPNSVTPLVSDDGQIFYRLYSDNLPGIEDDIVVPAREIIHDRMNPLFHPLVGVSPLFAAGVAATQGLNIQNNSATFFGNKSQPGGILIAPGSISADTAQRLKESWEENFTGENAGKIAVVGDGLKYEQLMMSAEDSQLIEQLKWTAEVICSVFHVPPFKIGVGALPSYNNVQSLNIQYYSEALQILIESAEVLLTEGLSMPEGLRVEIEEEDLLRMDSSTQMTTMKEGVSAGVLAPNEGRKKLNLQPKAGGDSPYLQQQNYSLEALAKRDAQDDPFRTSSQSSSSAPAQDGDEEDDAAETANDNMAAEANRALLTLHRGFADV